MEYWGSYWGIVDRLLESRDDTQSSVLHFATQLFQGLEDLEIKGHAIIMIKTIQ